MNAPGYGIMTMDAGMDLSWSSITIKASVDGAVPSQMTDGGTHSVNCWSTTDSWNVGEAIFDTNCGYMHNYHQRSKQQRGNHIRYYRY